MAAGFTDPAVTDNTSVCSEYLCTIYTRLTIKIKKRTGYTDSLKNTVICEDILMRNGQIECFWSEAYWQVRRSDENTRLIVYRKIARK